MKRARVEKKNRNFGVKADWYKHENVKKVEAENPTEYVGGKEFPAAYFVTVEEMVCDQMREFDSCYWVAVEHVGPFATKADAESWTC